MQFDLLLKRFSENYVVCKRLKTICLKWRENIVVFADFVLFIPKCSAQPENLVNICPGYN